MLSPHLFSASMLFVAYVPEKIQGTLFGAPLGRSSFSYYLNPEYEFDGGKWDISLKILFHAHRVTYKFSADFTLLTSLPPALVSAPAWASTTRQPAKFRSIDQARRRAGGPRFHARS